MPQLIEFILGQIRLATVLDTTYVPAWMPEGAAEAAAALGAYIARELGFVGVLGIVLAAGGVLFVAVSRNAAAGGQTQGVIDAIRNHR